MSSTSDWAVRGCLAILTAAAWCLIGSAAPAQNRAQPAGALVCTLHGDALSAEEFAQRVAGDSVLFLGEEHDNDAGHAWQLAIIRALHAQGSTLAISMEMFERDVQGALDDYLAGRISEEDFLAASRPWPNYREHYRPIVEFARRHRIPVIAANVPRTLASQTARGESILGSPAAWRPRQTQAPLDAYWDAFRGAMQGHGGTDGGEGLERMYRAQCLKDDAMAEAIGDFLDTHRHRQVLIVHLCGRFHSDGGLGTVERFRQRQRLARFTVVTMERVAKDESVNAKSLRDRAHYALAVPPNRDQNRQRNP